MSSLVETSAGRWIAVLRGSHERLRGLVEPLSADDLVRQSYAAEWSIAQVLSHLGSGAEIFALFLAAATTGEPAPPREAFLALWDVWNAKTPQEQAADAIASDRSLIERFEALDSDQLARLKIAMMGEDRDIATVAQIRLNEHALHTWDVAVALDPAATVAPDAVELLIDSLDRLVSRLGKPSGLYALVKVHTANPGRDLALTVGDAVSFGPWAGGDPTAELTIPAEALLRLVAGRLDPDHTPALTASGVDIDELRKVFPGY